MPASLQVQMLHKLECLVRGELSPHDVESWLASASWNVLRWGDEETIALVGEVGLELAEFDSGDLDEDDLRRRARALIARQAATKSPSSQQSAGLEASDDS